MSRVALFAFYALVGAGAGLIALLVYDAVRALQVIS